MAPNRASHSLLLAACLLALAGFASSASGPTRAQAPIADAPAGRPTLGLMGTIPIYWGEAASIEGHLNGDGTTHWARARLERSYALRPLATLDKAQLEPLSFLLLAQPRVLTPAENVALDDWVRGGGRLLLFADPMMTGHSRFAIGDPRRPQDVTLLSPILDHWGLALQFDDAQPDGPHSVAFDGALVPVRLPGGFIAGKPGECTALAGGVVARCAIGAGQVLAVADGAVLDLHDPGPLAPAALDALVAASFGNSRDIAGRAEAGQAEQENID